MPSSQSPSPIEVAQPAALGSFVYKTTIHCGLPVLVAAWTGLAVLMSAAVTALLIALTYGRVYWSDLAMSAAVTALVTIPIAWCVGKLVRELNRSRAGLQRLAQLDSLTGLPNRGYFFERAEQLLHSHELPAWPLSALMIDVDHFKSINDEAGHAAGDVVLGHVARILQRNLRADDFLARYGGEEFAALLPRTARATALAVADRMRTAIAEDAELSRLAERRVTISIGVAEALEAVPVDPVLLAADRALYIAKAAGRNRSAFLDVASSRSQTARLRALSAGSVLNRDVSVALE